MLRGDVVNPTEDRAATHAALRAADADAPAAVVATRDRAFRFAGRTRAGVEKGATGAPLTDVVAIGIGGSSLGPACVHEALRSEAPSEKNMSWRCHCPARGRH